MELIEGKSITKWVDELGGIGSTKKLRGVLQDLFRQCQTLDKAKIDHGELSNLRKHAIVHRGKVTLIDFESSSTTRRTSNMTSAIQYLFIGGPIAPRVRKLMRVSDRQELLLALREYKVEGEGAVPHLLAALNLRER
jgi:putative serine/threonine protein kinase